MLIAILLLAGAWSGWWVYGANQRGEATRDWFDARRADGWVAEYDEVSVAGFPNRFDTNIDGIELADPDAGWVWSAPFLQLLSLSYRTDHLIVIWPETQRIGTPRGDLSIGASTMRASLVTDGEARALERATLQAEALTLLPEGGETWDAAGLTIAIERQGASKARYRLGLTADGVAPALPERVREAPDDILPRRIEVLRADLGVTFDRPLDRDALEGDRPRLQTIDLALAEAQWGALQLQAAGELEIDTEGRPEGRLTIKARNWRDILELARRSGALPPRLVDPVGDALGFLSGLSGNRATLDIPLDFRRGTVFLGPVPVAQAPRLTPR